MTRIGCFVVALGVLGALADPASAVCNNKARANAWGAYVQCVERIAGEYYADPGIGAPPNTDVLKQMAACRLKLSQSWSAAACGGDRFRTFTVAGVRTVEDRLTGLFWTRPNVGLVTWSDPADATYAETGSAFAAIATLNQNAAGGIRGWRVANLAELQTLMNTVPGTIGFHAGVPAWPTTSFYWTSTSYPAQPLPTVCASFKCAWHVDFNGMFTGQDGKGGGGRFVLAVRGGL